MKFAAKPSEPELTLADVETARQAVTVSNGNALSVESLRSVADMISLIETRLPDIQRAARMIRVLESQADRSH